MLATSTIRTILLVPSYGRGAGASLTTERIAAATGATVRVGDSTAASSADLIIVETGTAPHVLGSSTVALLLGARVPVLLLSAAAARERFEPMVLPVRHADVAGGSLASALEWVLLMASASSAGEERDAEIRVLHVASDPDELYADLPLLRETLESEQFAPRVTLRACFRWGAHPVERIVSAVRACPDALLVLRRGTTGDHTWYRAVSAARCAVLLLPPEV